MLLTHGLARRVCTTQVEIRAADGEVSTVTLDAAGASHLLSQLQSSTGSEAEELIGHDQLLLSSPDLQARLGKKYCDETELLPLLSAKGLTRLIRTIGVEIHPLGGDNFHLRLEVPARVANMMSEITRVQGTKEEQQQLYRVTTRADGGAVREDDAEPERLKVHRPSAENGYSNGVEVVLADGEVVAMALKERPLIWRTPLSFSCFGTNENCDSVCFSGEDEDGARPTKVMHCGGERLRPEDRYEYGNEGDKYARIGPDVTMTSGVTLTGGRHYWEVELLSEDIEGIMIGVNRPSTHWSNINSGWFICATSGRLMGPYGWHDWPVSAGGYSSGDCVGVLLCLDEGSLCFFKNGVQHGPGFPPGTLSGGCVHAARMNTRNTEIRLLPATPPTAEIPIEIEEEPESNFRGAKIEFSVRLTEQKKRKFVMREKQKFGKLIRAAAEYFKMPNLRLIVDGEVVGVDQRPIDFDLEDGDMIDAKE
jgi:hypothetical protein